MKNKNLHKTLYSLHDELQFYQDLMMKSHLPKNWTAHFNTVTSLGLVTKMTASQLTWWTE